MKILLQRWQLIKRKNKEAEADHWWNELELPCGQHLHILEVPQAYLQLAAGNVQV